MSESSRTRRILEHSQTKTKLFLEWCRTRIEPITFCYVKMCVLQRWWWWWWLFNNSLPFRSFQLQAFAHAIDTMHLYTSQQERWMVQKSASRLFEELFLMGWLKGYNDYADNDPKCRFQVVCLPLLSNANGTESSEIDHITISFPLNFFWSGPHERTSGTG